MPKIFYFKKVVLVLLLVVPLFTGLSLVKTAILPDNVYACEEWEKDSHGCCLNIGESWCEPRDGCGQCVEAGKSCSLDLCQDGGGDDDGDPSNPPPSCNSTTPGAPTLLSPGNGSNLDNNDVNLRWSNNTSWGTGCPQDNQFRVHISEGCSGTYVRHDVSSSRLALGLSLNWGSRYCWYVQKHNGSKSANSAVWSFRINSAPTFDSGGFNHADTCSLSNGISGRYDNQSGEAENPISYRFSFSDREGDEFIAAILAFVPVGGPFGENADTVSQATIRQKVAGSNSIAVRIGQNGSVATVNNASSWSNGGLSGDAINEDGTATVIGIGTDTKMSRRGRVLTADFKIRFENTFPSRNYNVYATVLTQNPDGTIVSSYATATDPNRMGKIDSWIIDVINPSVSITGPSYNDDATFNMVWNASDNRRVARIYSYVWSDLETGSSLRDTTIPKTIDLTNQELNYPAASNAEITDSNLGSHRYRRLGENASYFFRLAGKDVACNLSIASEDAEYPEPWLITYQGGAYGRGGTVNLQIPEIPGFTVPFSSDTGMPFFSTYTAISGNTSLPTNRISKTNTFEREYDNLALKPPVESGFSNWHDYLLDLARRNNNGAHFISGCPISTCNKIASGNMSSVIGVASNSKVIYTYTGNLELAEGASCDVKGILFVNGTLKISSDLKRSPGNGCMYIVNGNVNIEPGSTKAPVALTSNTQPNYDVINGFFVVEGAFTTKTDKGSGTTNKYEGLYVDGSIISKDVSFQRDLNYVANFTHPGFIVRYDPSYYWLFKDDFGSRFYSIREVAQ